MTTATSDIVAGNSLTPEELLQLPDAVNYELVGGMLVERNTGMESSGIGGRIFFLLSLFLREHPLGRVFPAAAGYQCFPGAPRKVRKPDVSFIQFGRLEGDRVPAGHCLIAPDLAIEVLSPGNLVYAVGEKVDEYIGAGVRLVWIVNPKARTVSIHRPPSSPLGTFMGLAVSQTLEGEDVLPGFSRPVHAIFDGV